MKTKSLWTTGMAAFLLAAFVGGCKDENVEKVGICPLVISTNPANLATNVPLNQIVTVTFNGAMNPASITPEAFTLLSPGSPGGRTEATQISGSLSYNAANYTMSFVPSTPLASNATYTGTIATTVKDLLGNALQVAYAWTFSTSVLLSPTVVSTDPVNNATGVVLNKTVTATFSVPMDPLTLNATTFTVRQGTTAIAGAVSYTGATASFTPSSALLPNTIYTSTITTGAKNVVGTSMVSNYVWNFTTVAALPPTVVSTDPLNLATGVALNKVVGATFSMAMDPLTLTSSTFTLKLGATSILGTVNYTGTTVTFTPNSNLLSGSNYTATITTGAKNTAGLPLVADYVWTFNTVAALGPLPPNLATASIFGAFGGNAGITNQGLNTVINNGSISTTAASTLVTGFHDAITGDIYTETPLNVGNVTGGIFTAPPAPGTATSQAIATQGLLDATAAYNSISPASKPGGIDPGAGELGGLTLPPGIYKSAGATFNISLGNLTLDAQGDANAVWIFQTAAGLTVGIAGPTGARSVVMINGAQPKNVFWHVGSAATINAAGGGIMVGTIIANSGVTFSTAGNAVQTVLNGRAISLVASVTMVNTTVNVPN
jgi:hypothetical protein